ncbi:patatin-like phospholipase family protein [Sphingomonas sp. CGMCC 1.13654]|uniref:Patatin-like phospholipase family protein n=2 Tax=Sphingomonas chungangi TaxID=2683589 RepID=A0A838L740_9SPHN|nr:patatin-like phospholipase family protein [Sphingomonas chungangi]MVW57082.1 patatin [Sphingomonas chungangi]
MSDEKAIDLAYRILKPGPKKMLSIDGGGIRGVLSLGILAAIEQELKNLSGKPEFVLADYFDYIAGTSTGGIIAAGLSCGLTVEEVLAFYRNNGAAMFEPASLLRRLRYHFESEPLAVQLQKVFGRDTRLGSNRLRTLLLLVMRNATTDSPWPISNNPFAKYNRTDRDDCNLSLPLWQLIRASTAAPTYFPPEVITINKTGAQKDFVFVDGGVTTYNNPAFQMALMATSECYWPFAPAESQGWVTGDDKLLLVSIGTGSSPDAHADLAPRDMNLLFNAGTIPSALMFAALNEQDTLCRMFGNCVAGDLIDRELGDLHGARGPSGQKLFRYARYNADLSREGLDALGLHKIDPERVKRMDATDTIKDLLDIGKAVAKQKLRIADWNPGVFTP